MKVLHGWLKEQKVDVLVFVNVKYNRGKMNVLAVHLCVEREIRMSESLCDDQVLGLRHFPLKLCLNKHI